MITSRKWGYERLFPWIERGPIHDADSDLMICRKHSLVALTFCDSAKPGASAPPWLVLVLSAPNTTIWPVVDRYINGHEAFLTALEQEIQDACEVLRETSRIIGSVAMPPVGPSRLSFFDNLVTPVEDERSGKIRTDKCWRQ